MKLLEKGKTIFVYCAPDEDEAVQIAVNNLAADIKRVCECDVEFCNHAADSQIAICTAKDSDMPFEAFSHRIDKGTLYIQGADRRGTIFGIYDLSEQIGVSPWYYFGDVPARNRTEFSLPDNYVKFDYPSVKYRGIFLNDEEELEAWAKKHTSDETIGPEVYECIFELLLRLKANYIWPAMHVNYFNGDKRNAALANRMGIIVGTSHCDMLLRSNQNEWEPWLQEKGYKNVKYDYSIPGRNREILKEYWRESVELNKEYDVCYTVGMRGIHDTGFVTEMIDKDLTLTEEEKTEKKVKMLEEVIVSQREIINQVLGRKQGEKSLQLFIPYKEVLDLYDQGLKVPEDITIMWVDDNFGHMRRYPNRKERERIGGHGLYYHASYWAFPGMSYLFFNSNPLSQMGNELKKCYESGIQTVWVLNVGALKPLEIDMEYFLCYGWDAGKDIIEETRNADVFMQKWLKRNFCIDNYLYGAEIYNRCMQMTNVCKLEHMQSAKFVQTGYCDEAYERLSALKKYYDNGNQLYWDLPEKERDAFFQMFLMKIHASFYVNASFYYADRSRMCFGDGAMRAADHYVALSRDMDTRKRKLLYYYNYVLSDGKWEDILTPESFIPPPMALYPAGKPALVITEEKEEMFVEANGYISIPADRYTDACGVRVIENIGRGSGNAVEAYGAELPYVEYTFCVKSEGEFLLEIFRNLTLSPKGQIRMEICIDNRQSCCRQRDSDDEAEQPDQNHNEEKQQIVSEITDEWRGKWRDAVMNNGEKLYVILPFMAQGKHTLKIYMLDDYVTISKLVIYTEPQKKSNMGPSASPYYKDGRLYTAGAPEEFLHDNLFIYSGVPEQLEPLPMLYADADFWKTDRLYIKSDQRRQRMAKRKKYLYDSNGRKNVFEEFGSGAFLETEGKISIEAEYALENSTNAYITADADGGILWTHTQAETNGGNGLAMLIEGYGLFWEDPEKAQAMHYVINVKNPGTYHIWVLVKFDDDRSDSCYLALDGKIQGLEEQLSHGNLFTYSMKQRWNWQMITNMELTEGSHSISFIGRKSELRIDRIYMSIGNEYPPDDVDYSVKREIDRRIV